MQKSNPSASAAVEALENELFSKLKTEYETADKIFKNVEQFRNEAGIPSMNELRYAGYHLLHAIQPDGFDEEHLRLSINHCRRASYEAGEAGILSGLEVVAMFRKDYELIVVTDVLTDWVDILKRCVEIENFTMQAWQSGEDRSKDHANFIAYFNEIKSFCDRLTFAREELNKKIEDDRKANRRFVYTICLGVITLVVAIVFGLKGNS